MTHARTVCCAVFGPLVSSGAALPEPHTVAAPTGARRERVEVVGALDGSHVARLRRWLLPYCRSPFHFPYPVPDPVPYPVWTLSSAPSPTYVSCRQRLASPPRSWCSTNRRDAHRDGLLARQRSAPLYHDRRRWNEVRAHTVPFCKISMCKRTTDANVAQGFRFVVETNRSSNGSSTTAPHAPQRHRNNGDG